MAAFKSVLEGEAKNNLLFAVPKKGRLSERVLTMISQCGLDHHRAARLDVAHCVKLPVTMVFLPASDIAKYVGEGNVDIGITGQDIVAEGGVTIRELIQLGIGKCKLCVQGPVGMYKDPKELLGKRIVTSFPSLAKKFFDELAGNSDHGTRIRFVGGSVEVACTLGLADGIVDLVETGTTMRAAGLEIVSVIMKTQSVMIANPQSKHEDLIKRIKSRIDGYLIAKQNCLITYNVTRDKLADCVAITPGHEGPTLSSVEHDNWVAVSALIQRSSCSDVMDQLAENGAKSILITNIENARFP